MAKLDMMHGGSKRAPRCAGECVERGLFLLATFANAPQITDAYGASATVRVRDALHRRASDFLGFDGTVTWVDDTRLALAIHDRFSLAARKELRGPGERELLGAITSVMAREPVDCNDQQILPMVGVSAEPLLGAPVQEVSHEAVSRALMPEPVGCDGMSIAQYRSDMACAVRVARFIDKGDVLMAWQPVVSGRDGTSSILYYEGLLRLIDIGGEISSPGPMVAALERTGLIRFLDAHVVSLTLERLRKHPGLNLACNISAQSAVVDGWWSEALAELEEDPALASRLVIEITESASFTNVGRAVDFVGRVRALGCRVAIDDFGMGFAAFRTIETFRPDIVKIDAFFLRRALTDPAAGGMKAFRHLVGLALSCAGIVIVEGIEGEEGLRLAEAVGAQWFQGFYLGLPGMYLPSDLPEYWKSQPVGIDEYIECGRAMTAPWRAEAA